MSLGDAVPLAPRFRESHAQERKFFPMTPHQPQRSDPFVLDPTDIDPADSWPTMPDPATDPWAAPTQPLSTPTRYGYGHRPPRDWREGQADRAWQRDLDREVNRLQQRLRQLDAEEAAISAQIAALPQPASWITRLIIASTVSAVILIALAVYPALIIPAILILLIVARMRRHRGWRFRQRNAWANQERFRLESRWSGLVAERATVQANLTAIQAQLAALPQP